MEFVVWGFLEFFLWETILKKVKQLKNVYATLLFWKLEMLEMIEESHGSSTVVLKRLKRTCGNGIFSMAFWQVGSFTERDARSLAAHPSTSA